MKPIQKFGFLILLLLLIGSLIANRMLYARAITFYKRLNQIHLQPLGSPAQPLPSVDQPTLLLVGDSRAEQWKLGDQFNDFRIVNRGIGGQTTAQVVARIEQDLEVISPDIVILQAGINDLKTLPLFPEKAEEITETCKINLNTLLQLSAQDKRSVILTTIFPVGKPSIYRRVLWSPEVAAAVLEVNTYLKESLPEEVILLDAYSILRGGNELIDPNYAKDTLHLNEQGYEVLNQELLDVLENDNEMDALQETL